MFAAALAGFATAGSFPSLLIALALLHPASGAFVSLSQATLMDADPGRRGLHLVRWTIAGSVGALAGPALVAAAVFLDLGWRPLFAALAAVSAVLAVASLRAPHGRSRMPGGEAFRGALHALRSRAVLRWLVLLETSDLLLDVLRGFLALYLVDEAGLSRGLAAAAVSLLLAADLAGNFGLLRLLGARSGVAYLRWSAPAAAALFAALLLAPGALKLAPLALLGAATAGWYPVLKARLYAELPGRSGTAMTLGALAAPAGSAAPLAIGFLAEHVGIGRALWLLLLAPAALLALLPSRPADPRRGGSDPCPRDPA